LVTLKDAPQPWPSLVIFALAMGGFAIGVTEFATMSLLPFFAKDLHVDAPTAGHAISAYALGVVVGAPVIAVLAARMARRTLLVVLMGVFALGNGLAALSPSYGWLVAFRFLSGLPHGAYFGIAAMVASALVPANKRTQAIGQIFLGLTGATVIGVPVANWLGQMVGWRWSFGVVALLGLTALTLIALLVPHDEPEKAASPLRELAALKRPQVWLTLAIGAIGFGGLFAVYTYLASTLSDVTHVSSLYLPLVLCAFGLGLTAGNLVVPLFADRALMPTAGALLVWTAATLALYAYAAHNIWAVTFDVFLIGCGGAQSFGLQYGERDRPVARRHSHRRGLRLDSDRLGRLRFGDRRADYLAGVDRHRQPHRGPAEARRRRSRIRPMPPRPSPRGGARAESIRYSRSPARGP
jgi:DHA1 family inner membrane transport protein